MHHIYDCIDLNVDWKVIQPNGKMNITSQVKKSLCFRYPVYYGKPMKTQYKRDNVPQDYTQPFGIKYAVCGIAYIHPSINSFVSIHTWGPNLESKHTVDYFSMVHNDQLDIRKYELHLRKTLQCIRHAKRVYKLEKVYCPFIGQGAFLNSLNESEKVKAHKRFFKLVRSFRDILFVTNNSMFDKYFSEQDTNVSHENLFEPRKGRYGIVNAWDSNSYIGNGLRQDGTIDGFYVAGWGPNKKLKNTSFLHNPFFHISHCPKP